MGDRSPRTDVLLFIAPQARAEPLACRVYSCIYLCPPSSSPDRPASVGSVVYGKQRADASHRRAVSYCAPFGPNFRQTSARFSLATWHQQAAEAQPRHRARVWRQRALPDRRRSRAHRAARLEGRLAAAHPDGWRYLQRAEARGQVLLLAQAIWLEGYNDSMVCLREANCASLRLPRAR